MTHVKTTPKESPLSTGTFIIALCITLAMFLGMSVQILYQYSVLKKVESQNMRLGELSGIIIHLDEVLTMSACMGAVTGNLKWEERYLYFEPQLDIAIQEVMELSPETFIGQKATQTNAANIKLIVMEKQAFELVRQRQSEAAMDLLYSNEYVEQKQIYAEGMENITDTLQMSMKISIKRHHQQAFLTIVVISIVLPFLIFAWIYAIIIIRKNATIRIEVAEIRGNHHKATEQRVIERTAELEIVNEELKCESEERELVTEALQESEDKFRSISTSVNEAIIMLDNDGKVSYWNKAAENILGYLRDEAEGKEISKFIIPERYREKHIKGFERFKDTGTGNLVDKTMEIEAIKKNGVEISIELSLSVVKRGGKWNAIGLIRDISERKRIENELRVSHKMMSVGRLSASVFHEILNPVNIIGAHTQLLLLDAEEDSKAEEDLKSIQNEIERIVEITENLLKFSKKESEKVEQVEVNSLLENIFSLLKTELNSKNIKPDLKLEKELPEVMVHDSELQQAFLNIVSNAIDAMPTGGTLTIKTQRMQRKGLPLVSIKFIDTGCGIAKDDIDKVLEPFFSTKKEIKGVGLGLSSAYAIISGYGGNLSVESKEGMGATVIVHLPVKI